MLDSVVVNTNIEILEQAGMHYDQGFVRLNKIKGTLDQWMFHVTEIRRVAVQRNEVGKLRVYVYLIGGDSFSTKHFDRDLVHDVVPVAAAFLSLRDYECALEPQNYAESCFYVDMTQF